jgi:CubicO group peptidase (beta-lactamase class C family)
MKMIVGTQQRPLLHSAAWLLSGCLASTAAAANLQDCLRAHLQARPDFSGAVLIRQQGQEAASAQGALDAQGTPLHAQTRFNLGSANKMFTAVAVAQLVAQDKLALDAPIGRWVEGLAPPVAAVTLRQLLTHSGGLGNFIVPGHLEAMQQAGELRDLLVLVDDTRPQFEPGSRFRYSNTGFLLLGLAVEKASGQRFSDYVQRHVFEPAGMTQTSMDAAKPTRAATGFTRWPEPKSVSEPVPPRPTEGPSPAASGARSPGPMTMASGPLRRAAESALTGNPAGSAYSTVQDMARFFKALRSGRLVSAEQVKEMTRAQIDAGPPHAPKALQYGLGFGVQRWERHTGLGHNGGAPGVNVEAVEFPDDEVTLVVLSNRDPPAAHQTLAELRRAVLGGTFCR